MEFNNLTIKKILYIAIPLLIVAIIVVKLKNNKSVTDSKVFRYTKEQPINVATQKIQLQKIESDFFFTGTFEPNKESKLSAEMQGKVNVVLADVGSNVSKGQTLIQLDNSLLKLQLQTVNVQIEGLENDVKRYTILTQADAVQGVQLEKAIIGLKTAKIQKETLLEQIHKTVVKAPFAGVVTGKLTEIGSFAAPGIPLLQLTEIGTLRFTINVSEKDLAYFKMGQTYGIQPDAMPEKKLHGKITMIGSKSNIGNSFPVQFSVQNIGGNIIKAGMFGKAAINASSNEQGIVIPASVLMGNSEKPQVYIVKNGKAKLINISIYKRTENKIVVSSGLQVGDVIITNGFVNLFDGANISIK